MQTDCQIDQTNSNHRSAENSHKIRLLKTLSARDNPFADLVRVSLLLNPQEYELPEDYVPNIQFPGSSKRLVNFPNREARLTSYSMKRAQELDGNELPLILRTCYVCRKGCRKAPLIHCDYCPLVYHADCVDPPLTILPNTRWMCPNHVEPVAEEKLLSTSSLCERVKLWNHFSKPIDHESIKISFLDKVHESSSPPPDSSEFIKLGCRVPRRIKKEYDRYIVTVEKYESESDTSRTDQIECEEETDQEVCTSVGLSVRQMIESSKILESREHELKNGETKQEPPVGKPSSINANAKEREEWLEFLQKLANPNSIEASRPSEASASLKTLDKDPKMQDPFISSNSTSDSKWSNSNRMNSSSFRHSHEQPTQHQGRCSRSAMSEFSVARMANNTRSNQRRMQALSAPKRQRSK